MTKGKDYTVGYGRPPAQHRFKPGQSGNPRGRKSRKRNESEIIAMVRDELITMTINGKTRRITAFEAAIRKTFNTCLAKGNVRDLEKLFQLFARYGAEPEEQRIAQMKEASEQVLDKIGEIFRKTAKDRRHLIRHASEEELECPNSDEEPESAS